MNFLDNALGYGPAFRIFKDFPIRVKAIYYEIETGNLFLTPSYDHIYGYIFGF